MTTYALIHGAYDVGWYWHLVERELQERGHRSVAPDLPIEDDDASLQDHAQSVVDAIDEVHDGGELIIVGQSWGGYIAPIVAHLAKADRLVLVAPMVPKPGETDEDMWKATGWTFPQGEADAFYHDVDPALAAEAKSRERDQSETTSREPWPLDAWPSVPTHVIIGKNDRFFPADWLRGVVRERLEIEPDEIACGHTVALSRPRELVELMESYRTTSARPTGSGR
jgi:pimeloyl-ACP methyl ester carboxylesterase